MSAKEVELEQCLAEAEKHLKTSFLKRQPNYELAADRYQRAAQLARGQNEKQRDLLLKAADCFVKQGSFYSAGKQVEAAALVSRDMKDFAQVAALFERASNLFVQHRSIDSAALVLERGAKILEQQESHWKDAIAFYKRGAELALMEEKNRQAGEFYGNALKMALKLKDYDDALNMVLRQRESYEQDGASGDLSGRLVVYQILIQIARGDEIAAQKALRDGSGWLDQEQYDIMSTLLKGFDEREPDLIVHALNHPFLKHMDTEMAKVARNLRQMHLEKAENEKQASASTSNAEAEAGNDNGFDASELL
ncbi:gamma-soluble NSF attachment protein [Galendromus occidentalis]|uniref:Gamma-soluble NSF attachment protein n=1 Tax=Galendromus occidentalis TaxID=34638 RepID=A0AAJ6QNY0_9ACAR|nr:gamma-soluble NSF attachment protein [Galendromus occidentalis]